MCDNLFYDGEHSTKRTNNQLDKLKVFFWKQISPLYNARELIIPSFKHRRVSMAHCIRLMHYIKALSKYLN